MRLFFDIYFMLHLKRFSQYAYTISLDEGIELVTANWCLVTDQNSVEKKEGNGALLYRPKGNFDIRYIVPGSKNSVLLKFYYSKESSFTKESVCSCIILNSEGKNIFTENYSDINLDNFFNIIATFFDSCDLEKTKKGDNDKFLMGLAKSIKNAIEKNDDTNKLPSSFIVFNKCISDFSSSLNKIEKKLDKDHYEFSDLIKQFVNYYKNTKEY
jgi:hypothetical protein